MKIPGPHFESVLPGIDLGAVVAYTDAAMMRGWDIPAMGTKLMDITFIDSAGAAKWAEYTLFNMELIGGTDGTLQRFVFSAPAASVNKATVVHTEWGQDPNFPWPPVVTIGPTFYQFKNGQLFGSPAGSGPVSVIDGGAVVTHDITIKNRYNGLTKIKTEYLFSTTPYLQADLTDVRSMQAGWAEWTLPGDSWGKEVLHGGMTIPAVQIAGGGTGWGTGGGGAITVQPTLTIPATYFPDWGDHIYEETVFRPEGTRPYYMMVRKTAIAP